MSTKDYNSSIIANITAKEAFKHISLVNTWWGANFKGCAEKLNDTFTITFGETWVNFKITEVILDKKIVWAVTDCCLPWLKDKAEWTGTKIIWQLSEKKGATTVNMTHLGLVPSAECYENCEKGWNFYITESLQKLLTTGKGLPDSRVR